MPRPWLALVLVLLPLDGSTTRPLQSGAPLIAPPLHEHAPPLIVARGDDHAPSPARSVRPPRSTHRRPHHGELRRPGGTITVPSRAVHVHDGDTLYLASQAFRLRGVDTPELGRPGALAAKRRLRELLRGHSITIVRHTEDLYRRILVDVFVDGRNVADILRGEGHAKPRTPPTLSPGPVSRPFAAGRL